MTTILMEMIKSALVASLFGALVGSVSSALIATHVSRNTTRNELAIAESHNMLLDSYRALLFSRAITAWVFADSVDQSERRIEEVKGYLDYFKISGIDIPSDPKK